MKAIDYLVREHEEISRFLDRLEKECISILNNKTVDFRFFKASIEFIRNYADGIHHKKEEDILFKYMIDNLGVLADKVVRGGMLVEHQLARGYVYDLETSLSSYKDDPSDKHILQIIATSMGYVNLLRKHVDKENSTVYKFAEDRLSEDVKSLIEKESIERITTDKKYEQRKEELFSIIFN